MSQLVSPHRPSENSFPSRSAALFAGWLGLAGTIAALIFLYVTSNGTLDLLGRPLGTDFSSFWSAGDLALHGQAASAYDWGLLRELQARLFGERFFPWSYPPVFLLLATGLAVLPYLAALLVWQGVTLGAAAYVFTRIIPGRGRLLIALGSPAAFICLVNGQTGFLTAALLAGGVLALPRRPVLAGILFGAVCYKPHLGLLIPVALLAVGAWRAIASAAATVLTLVGVTWAVWGRAVWSAFLVSFQETQRIVMEQGGPGFEKFQSFFAWLRLLEVPAGPAYAAQGVLAVVVAGICFWIWRKPLDQRLKGAVLLIGALLATPYVFDYDFVVLGIAAAMLWAVCRDRMPAWGPILLAAIWVLPAAARTIEMGTHVPVGTILLGTAMTWAVVEAVSAERSRVAPAVAGPADAT